MTDPYGTAISVGTGSTHIRINSLLNGFCLSGAEAHVTTNSSSGSVVIAIYNVTDSTTMVSTNLSIDPSEPDSSTAVSPVVISNTGSAVSTGDEIRLAITGAGTGAKGVIVDLLFTKYS